MSEESPVQLYLGRIFLFASISFYNFEASIISCPLPFIILFVSAVHTMCQTAFPMPRKFPLLNLPQHQPMASDSLPKAKLIVHGDYAMLQLSAYRPTVCFSLQSAQCCQMPLGVFGICSPLHYSIKAIIHLFPLFSVICAYSRCIHLPLCTRFSAFAKPVCSLYISVFSESSFLKSLIFPMQIQRDAAMLVFIL